jgi:glycolate oxidase
MLLITVDGMRTDEVERDYIETGKLCEQHGALEVFIADSPTTSERVWRMRRNISEACSLLSSRQANEDIVVPPASIPEMVAKFAEFEDKYNLTIPCFGHAGDGNLHARLIPSGDIENNAWKKLLPEILDELYCSVAALGGRISGEHGIGHKRKKYMEKVVSSEYLNMLRAVKKALDPNMILNPGKIFDCD